MLKSLFAVPLLLMSSAETSADECSIEDVRYYEKTVGGGDRDDVRVSTIHCADFLIRNTSEGGRYDAIVEATLTDGSSSRVQVRTPRIQPGQTHPGDVCFGGLRIRKLACSWR